MITCEFDAPRHLVYRAWTTPELVKRWFGANHGEVTLAEIDSLDALEQVARALAGRGARRRGVAGTGS